MDIKNGPSSSASYSTYTADYTVQTDKNVDTVYYPGEGNYYWLASPSSFSSDAVCGVTCNRGGRAGSTEYSLPDAICPLVSLDSTVQLNLES